MRKRLLSVLARYGIILLIGLAYAVWIFLTDIKFPCIIKKVSGIDCPGCGATRMMLSLLKLDFKSAFYYNPFLLTTSPILLFCLAYGDINYIRTGNYKIGKLKYLLWIELALAIIFCIIRNII